VDGTKRDQAPAVLARELADVADLFAAFGMYPVGFYDLRDVGGYVALSAREGGAVSQLMGKAKQVIAELRDRLRHGAPQPLPD